MARLIDADKIPYEECYVPDGDIQWEYKKALIAEKTVVDQMPTVDAVPVVHGRWLYYSTTMQECSNCHRHTSRHKFKYCPHCGAIMEDNYHESTD